ncbi:MAG: fluoride efflux transporter CrcB [Nitrospirae bacterium]|nr:fluoride efflux transporter CrcB [Nitrospirota bacterium]MBI3351154.1 fluoride efflux transporter CrcB [Nitrospirota bacterium]
MGLSSLLAIGITAAAGAWLRWGLGIFLNPVFPTVPLGTLAANLIGGFLMGIAMVYLDKNPAFPPEVRLAVTTGFLGGLTTFSTFSAETVTLFVRQEFLWSLVIIVSHVAGSLGMTLLGILTIKWLSGGHGPF